MAPTSKRAGPKGKRARVKRRATREFLNVTVSPATIERLDALSAEHMLSRGAIVDVATRRLETDLDAGRFAWCAAGACTRIRPDGCGGEWRCEEHEA